jgi:hypothetical protein
MNQATVTIATVAQLFTAEGRLFERQPFGIQMLDLASSAYQVRHTVKAVRRWYMQQS